MSDLGLQIRAYYEEVIERVDPMAQPAAPTRGPSHRPALVVAAALLLVAVAVGLVPLLARLVADDPVVDEPTPTVTTTPELQLPTTTLAVPPPPDAVDVGARLGPTPDVTKIASASWGYVAISRDPQDPEAGVTSVWLSDDAVAWVEVSLPASVGTLVAVNSMAVWDDRVVLLGWVDTAQSEELSAVLLVTSDGEDWERMALDVMPDGSQGIEAVGRGLVLVTASSAAQGGSGPDRLYRSVDGVSWLTTDIPPDLFGDINGFDRLVLFDAGDGGLGLTRWERFGTVVTVVVDADGVWSRLEQDLGFGASVAAIGTGPDAVIAAGSRRVVGEGGAPSVGVIYRWTSGGWVESASLGGVRFSDLTHDGTRFVAVGVDGDNLPGVWESADGLTDWNRIAGGPATLAEPMPDLVGESWGGVDAVWRLRGGYRIDFVGQAAAQGEGGRIVSTDPGPGETLDFGQTVHVVVTEVETADAGPAPWSNPPLQHSEVPDVLIRGWSDPENQECPALGLKDQADQAVPRLGGFGSTVSYDNPDGPGMRGDSSVCIDCGRSAYGIPFGVVFNPDRVLNDWAQLPAYHLEWDDGSWAILPRPHPTAEWQVIDPETGQSAEPEWTAHLWLDNDCHYRIWSWLGPNHLLELLEDLRFVQDLAPP